MGISFICGFTALAYEVLWTRLLVFSIASTVYSFSMMLTVFLFGIFLGSLLLIPLLSKIKNLRTILIVLQGGVGIYIICSIYGLESILSPPWNAYNLGNPVAAFWNYFRDSAALMLIPTLLLGMCFPLLIQLISGKHENIGFNFLKKYFKPEVVEPIKLHVQAKRYLCREKSYWNTLSEASKVSLKLQGGIMDEEEAQKFTSLKFHYDAILLRKYDDEGKIPNAKMKKIEEYRNLINSQLI